jgi:hypothetical protein
MKNSITKIKAFKEAVLDDKLTFVQMASIALFLLVVVAVFMYSYDPTSFDAYKHF